MPQTPSNQGKPFFGVKVSKAGIPVNQATDKQLISKDDFSTKTWYDDQNARIVEGLLPDSTYGMWVSKPGFDVDNPDASITNGLIFNSNQDILKVISSGNLSVTVTTTGDNQNSVNHGLGAPFPFIGYITGTPFSDPHTTWRQLPFVSEQYNPISGLIETNFSVFLDVDESKIYLHFVSAGTLFNGTYTVKYYFVQESLT